MSCEGFNSNGGIPAICRSW